MDTLYSLRKLVPVVLTNEQEPIYGEHVENELVSFLDKSSRYELALEAYLMLKQKIKSIKRVETSLPAKDRIAPFLPLLKEIESKAHAVVFCEVAPSPENYKLLFTLVTTQGEVLHNNETFVDDRFSLASFSTAVLRGLVGVEKGIPFDGSILSREGYRVVIDRGFPDIRQGMEIPVFTLENNQGTLTLEETGRIIISAAEEHLSFGKIAVEKKPLEVTAGNKIRLPISDGAHSLASISPSSGLISISNSEVSEKPTLGYLNVHLGASVVSLNNSPLTGSAVSSNQLYYPGGSLRGEIWLTRKLYFDLGYQFAFTVLKSETVTQNSNVSSFRAQLGYRLFSGNGNAIPTVILKTGMSKTQFVVDPSSDPFTFITMGYSGLILGAGVTMPVEESFNLGFELNTLIFRSVSESPVTSGKIISRSSAWEFSLRGQYHLTPVIDIDATIQFQNYSADFEGQGTRTTPLSSSSQSVRAFLAGLAYYF